MARIEDELYPKPEGVRGADLPPPEPPQRANGATPPKRSFAKLEAFDTLAWTHMKLPDEEWIIQDLLRVPAIAILAGKPGKGKSWLAMMMAHRVAAGLPLWDKFEVKSSQVLYLDNEAADGDIQRRLRAIRQDHPHELAHKLFLPTRAQTEHLEPFHLAGLNQLDEWCAEHPETRLVVIDIWANMAPVPDNKFGGNAYHQDYKIMRPLKDLVIERNICLLLVHHFRKGEAVDVVDAPAGTTGFIGMADIRFFLVRDDDSLEATLIVKGRMVREDKLALHHDIETGLWELAGTTHEVKANDARAAVLLALEAADGDFLTPRQIATETRRPYTTVCTVLARLVRDKLVEQIRRGRYRLVPRSGDD